MELLYSTFVLFISEKVLSIEGPSTLFKTKTTSKWFEVYIFHDA
jgi:hypothetical protein